MVINISTVCIYDVLWGEIWNIQWRSSKRLLIDISSSHRVRKDCKWSRMMQSTIREPKRFNSIVLLTEFVSYVVIFLACFFFSLSLSRRDTRWWDNFIKPTLKVIQGQMWQQNKLSYVIDNISIGDHLRERKVAILVSLYIS